MYPLDEKLQVNSATRAGMPLVMGVLNVTPDSFSDGGQFVAPHKIEQAVQAMIACGVDIIDVGGESTRPGATPVELAVELERVIPVIKWIKQHYDVAVSIDTYKPEVMQQAIELGVDLVNDVNALQASGAVEVVAQSEVSVCLMHKQGQPDKMQDKPIYDDVVAEVKTFLQSRIAACLEAGIAPERIMLDPGFGFGKTLTHNVALFNELNQLQELGYPLLVGVSRKRMIGEILDHAPVSERLQGSVAAAVLAGMKGAKMVRVHDVKETVEAFKVVSQLL